MNFRSCRLNKYMDENNEIDENVSINLYCLSVTSLDRIRIVDIYNNTFSEHAMKFEVTSLCTLGFVINFTFTFGIILSPL